MKIRFRIMYQQLGKVKELLQAGILAIAKCGTGHDPQNEEICLCVSEVFGENEETIKEDNIVIFKPIGQMTDDMDDYTHGKNMLVKGQSVAAVCYVGEENLKVVYFVGTEYSLVDNISVIGNKIELYMDSADVVSQEMNKKNAQVFGTATVRMLKKMKIGVVGVSGTGSIVVEQLLRLGVGELVLVDNDIVEEKNLNRIINSKRSDAANKKFKVEMIKDFVKEAELETRIISCKTLVANVQTVNELSQCDILFGCLDSVDGRHHLNIISSAYLIPYFDVGVKLVADGMGGIDEVTTATHYIQPGNSSLLSRHVYDVEKLTAASLKRSNLEEYEERLREKYIVGAQESSPAVISVNMLAASMVVLEFLARIHQYREEDMLDVETIRMELTNMRAITQEKTAPCEVFKNYFGIGDKNPLMDI